MEKILENGTEVLIFNYISGWGLEQDMEHYIRGTIIKSEMSEDLSYHGSPWNVINYTVLGEDGIEYFGNYGKHTLGRNFFMTEEDYIELCKQKAEKEARDILANHLYPFEMVKERFINNNMTDEEFEQFLKDVGE